MSYKGAAPKDDGERVRRNKPAFDDVPIEFDGERRGPELTAGYNWCNTTRTWWENFRRSPNAMMCVDSDWEYLLDTALLHHRMWVDPDSLPVPHLTALAAEFRRRMSNYGYTVDDRLKQRIKFDTPQSRQQEAARIAQEAKEAVDYMEILNQNAAKLVEKDKD